MNIDNFVQKWKASKLKESAGSQSHFNDLCELLGQPKPTDVDHDGSWYTFEKGASKQDGGDGFADVWFKGKFAWEYKGKHKNLDAAYSQLLQYRDDLENPPLLIVSDMERFIIHTNFTGTIRETHEFNLDDLYDQAVLQKLKWVFTEPERLKPGITPEQITKEVAAKFVTLADALRDRYKNHQEVAHFLSKLLFCLFAEDVKLLPDDLFTKLIKKTKDDPVRFSNKLKELFRAMCDGGDFGYESIAWFNGGLFDDDLVLDFTADELDLLEKAAEKDWSQIEPSIFGTLFERGLDPDKRSQLGAHYTPRSDIERVIDPVITNPLRGEWDQIKNEVKSLITEVRNAREESQKIKIEAPKKGGTLEDEKQYKTRLTVLKTKETNLRKKAVGMIDEFLNERLRKVTVLDPACGSGNFLYVALERLHDLEKECLILRSKAAHKDDLAGQVSSDIRVNPEQIYGIELNQYAHELAQVTVWIGHLQWMLENGFGFEKNPVLKKLKNIECKDAIIDLLNHEKPSIPDWPNVDFIVGNPPFLGDKKMKKEISESYANSLRKIYKNIPGRSNLVCYWFERARNILEKNQNTRVGLVSTKSIRAGSNRVVLDLIKEKNDIIHAWSDEPWIDETGAQVRISIICFGNKKSNDKRMLDGKEMIEIYSDLRGESNTSKSSNLTKVLELKENTGVAFQGTVKDNKFEIKGELARKWIISPNNPNGKSNADVLKKWTNSSLLTKQRKDYWIIDFGLHMPKSEATLYELPFEYLNNLLDEKFKKKRKHWWQLHRPRPELRDAIKDLNRFILTPRHSRHRVFTWSDHSVLPDSALVVIAKSDDTFLGILHSKFHELWTLDICNYIGAGNDPRYSHTDTFNTFPFPEGIKPNLNSMDYESDPRAVKIAEVAKKLYSLRENWLNPNDLIVKEKEVVEGYPERILPKNEEAEKELKKRTLTNLYKLKPQWLQNIHRELDEAVCEAYGWELDILDDENEILSRLFKLNQERAKNQ